MPGARSLEPQRQCLRVADPVGYLTHERRMSDRPLRVSAAVEQCDDTLSLGCGAYDLASRDERELVRGEGRVLGLMRVGPVHAGGLDVQDDEAVRRLGIVELP